MSRIHFGGQQHEFLALQILGREQPKHAVDYFDSNWLACTIEVNASSFRGNVQCSLLTEDLLRLRDIARNLHDWSENELGFIALEDALRLDFFLDERGGIELVGELREHSTRNRLHFAIKMDQSYLPSIINDLDRAIREFPVIGSPPFPQ